MASSDDGQRILALLQDDECTVLRRWVDAAAQPLQGLLTPTELERDLAPLLAELTGALGSNDADVRTDRYAGARALLSELSRDRARHGFTPTQTVSSVFALKEVLLGRADERGEPFQTIIGVSRWVDALAFLPSRLSRVPGSR